MIVFKWWLVWRYFKTGRKYLNLTTYLSVLGMALGVGSLIVAMVVVSSYLTTLRSTVTDSIGDVMLMHTSATTKNMDSLFEQVQSQSPQIQTYSPYLSVESVFVHSGQASGAIVQGFDMSSIHDVLNLKKLIVKGDFDPIDTPGVFIGQRLAKKYKLEVGDKVTLVVPMSQTRGSSVWRPKASQFVVRGILAFGRYDYDTKYIVTELKTLQNFANLGTKITGLRLKLKDSDQADLFSQDINSNLSANGFYALSWRSVNRVLFSAADYEKYIIFFILLIIVIAACFTISSTLYVHVMRRFQDISILKTIGAPPKLIRQIFTYQGLLLGLIGCLLGVVLAALASYLFLYGVENWNLLGAQVYTIDKLELTYETFDVVLIFTVSLFICFLATVAPARRGAKLMPIEGLKYE